MGANILPTPPSPDPKGQNVQMLISTEKIELALIICE